MGIACLLNKMWRENPSVVEERIVGHNKSYTRKPFRSLPGRGRPGRHEQYARRISSARIVFVGKLRVHCAFAVKTLSSVRYNF
jgi:hypothetical protein